MKKILCHVGPWSADHYRYIAQKVAKNTSVKHISGHPKCDEVGYFNRYYELLNDDRCEVLEAKEYEAEIVSRCRLLRALKKQDALTHLRAAWIAIGEVLDRECPELVLSETIDSYLMDILYIQSKRRDILFIGKVPSFVSGYFRITAKGEYIKTREVAKEEIESVLIQLLDKSYRPDFIQNSDARIVFYVIERWLRNAFRVLYYYIKTINKFEKYNYHNWASLIVAKQWFHLCPQIRLGDYSWRRKLIKAEKPILFVPLQMVPEATVDYWCDNIEAIDYEVYLKKILAKLSIDFVVVVKEHPNVLGHRNPGLYKDLLEFDSVVFVPTEVTSHEVIEISDAILVWTGSVGFEAAIRGKPVLTTCNPYYKIGPMFMHVDLCTEIQEIHKFISVVKAIDIKFARYQMVEHILSGLMPGRYIIDGTWSSSNEKHREYAENIATQLNNYMSFRSRGRHT